MEPINVGLRYLGGRTTEGVTQDFSPGKDSFHLYSDSRASGKAVEVRVKELKAVFFGRGFVEDSQYSEQEALIEEEKGRRQNLMVTFVDGEVLVGSTNASDHGQPGFFLFPPDPVYRHSRVFVVFSAVISIRHLFIVEGTSSIYREFSYKRSGIHDRVESDRDKTDKRRDLMNVASSNP